MIVVGTAWLSTLAGLWMHLGWARRAAVVVALATMLHLGLGTVIGIVAVVCLADPRLRTWLASPGVRGAYAVSMARSPADVGGFLGRGLYWVSAFSVQSH
jgi:hypothetical protein